MDIDLPVAGCSEKKRKKKEKKEQGEGNDATLRITDEHKQCTEEREVVVDSQSFTLLFFSRDPQKQPTPR